MQAVCWNSVYTLSFGDSHIPGYWDKVTELAEDYVLDEAVANRNPV